MKTDKFEKYKNKDEYPPRGKVKFPKPSISHFDSYSEHGVAMDEWQANIEAYEPERKTLVGQYRIENKRLFDLFIHDLLDEMDALYLSAEKQEAISNYIATTGDGDFNEMKNVAENMTDLVSTIT